MGVRNLLPHWEQAANDLKNIMLNFDRTAAKRTTVIDDDADYFDSSATTWLSNDEKAKMKAQHDEQLKEADRQKRQITFTIDLAGQKLVVDRQKQPPTEKNERTHTAGETGHKNKAPKLRKNRNSNPNPTVSETFI